MFDRTKEITDILEEKLDLGDNFTYLMKKNRNQYSKFVQDYKLFMQYMIFQYDLIHISSSDDILNLLSRIKTIQSNEPENNLSFILRSINKISKKRPMKFELYLKLLLGICEINDKKDDQFQDLLLSNITNRYFLCKLYENEYFPFDKMQKVIRPNNLLYYLFYFQDKLPDEKYDEWIQSLQHSNRCRDIIFKSQQLNETDIYILKTQRENPNQISLSIRHDDREKFINLTAFHSISYDSFITRSINETNSIFLKSKKCSLIDYSAFYGATKIFKFLISNGAKYNSNTLKFACAGGNYEIIRILNQNKILFNLKCLNKSIKYFSELRMIDFIIENSDLTIGLKEIQKSICSFNFPVFTYFLSQDLIQSVNSKSENFLHFSVVKNNFQITKFLCEILKNYFNKDLINLKDSNLLSPLMKAVSYGYLNIVKILIENGANCKDVDDRVFF